MQEIDVSDRMLLESIYHYCQQIEKYVERFGDDYSTFCADFAYYEGVTMNILQLGEKAGRLSDGFRERTKKQIPWQIIRGMRNLLAHNYDNLDVQRIWETIHMDIPAVKAFCEAELPLLAMEDVPTEEIEL